jgi:hypothetical protein
MTTFTTEDRIIAEKNGSVTINVEPIPFAGWVNTAPPHIVDSGASVEIDLLRQYVSELEKALESSLALNKAQAERQEK